MSVFTPPQISLDKLRSMGDIKEYLRDLNRKIRFLSENVDRDNFDPEEYRKIYSNGDRSVELYHSIDEFKIEAKKKSEGLLARIRQTADEISLLAEKGTITNEVNISTEKIFIHGNKLWVNSENFVLDDVGNMSMRGDIYAKSGYFGGYAIAEEGGKQYLKADNGVVRAATLAGTNIMTDKLDIATDEDISGCSIDFSNCHVKSNRNSYFGWFYSDNVTASKDIYAHCGSADVVECAGKIFCYDYWSDNQGIAYSDRRLKEEIREIPDEEALRYILSLRPVEYELKDEAGVHYGLIAQDIIGEGDPYHLVEEMEDGYYCINYESLDALIAGAMRQQEREMEGISVGL